MPVKRQNAGPSRGEKRTRFGSPTEAPQADGIDAEDAFLEEDIPEGTSTTKARQRRLVQDTDGYGSDSSNEEGEGVVPSRRPGAKDDEDDDVDMFAEDSDKKAGAEPSKGKGKQKDGGNKYMDLNEIEGQEFDDQPAQFGDAEYMSDEGEDEEAKRARKRLQVLDGGMGIDITPFNMKSEMEEGKFTADGETYQENERDPNEKHDTWLSNLDQEEIEKAKRAHEERERLERERQQKEDDLGAAKDKENEVMREAVKLMERGETVLEALQRLGKEVEDKRRKEEAGQKKKSWAERQKERKAAAEAEQRSAADEYHTSNPFTNLSNIVSTLTAIGHLDVYSLSRESLQRMLPAEPSSNGRPTSVQDDRQLQYRFSMAYVRNLPEAQRPVEREIFGPFSVSQLQQWRGTGFFGGPACENVELRTAPQPGQEASLWGSWAEVVEKAQ